MRRTGLLGTLIVLMVAGSLGAAEGPAVQPERPAGSGVIEWDFPEPVGTQPAMYTLHSEPATLPETIQGVRDVRWRLALPHAVHAGFSLHVAKPIDPAAVVHAVSLIAARTAAA